MIARLPNLPRLRMPKPRDAAAEPRGRGRPKLGVVAREVTLLPRHWDWLGAQPGGASVALRKLVEQARRTSGDADRARMARDAAYHFMSVMAGNLRASRKRRGRCSPMTGGASSADRRLARRHPRPRRQARLQRSRRAVARSSRTPSPRSRRASGRQRSVTPNQEPPRVETPLRKTFLRFLAPMMLSNVLQSLFGTVNASFLAR